MKVLIADDEKLARQRLRRLLSAMPEVELAGECASGQEVLDALGEREVDVLLLDIRMPGLSGLDALALLPAGGPVVVFCTAYPDHAVEAFEHGAVDYLLKPVEASRLRKAIDRAARSDARERQLEELESRRTAAEPFERLAIRTRDGIVLIDPADITHAVIENQLVTVYGTSGQWLSEHSLQALEERLPAERFVRVHRQALLNLGHVERFEDLPSGGYVARTTTGQLVTVSRQAARRLRRRLGL